MNSTAKKSILSTIPVWVSSIITALLSLFVPFIVAGIGFLFGKLIGLSNQKLAENDAFVDLIGYLLTGIVVAIMCFLICRAHPKSIWYTPIICNVMTILMGGNYLTGELQLHELLLTLGIGWVLSIIAAIWGRNIGLRNATKE